MKIRQDVKSLTVESVADSWANSTIRANPEYQRGIAWTASQRKLLIDSIFRGYPLPRFYFHMKTATDPLGNPVTALDVIDGQQRMIAMAEYRQGNWALFDPTKEQVPLPRAIRELPCPWGGKTFSQLPQKLQDEFLHTELAVVMIEAFDTPDEVRDLFIRLQAGTALTRQQVRDAWPANMGPYAEELAGKLARRPRFAAFGAIDKRGQRQDVDTSEDVYPDDRQTCAQLLTMFLGRRRTGRIPGVGARAVDETYHTFTDFDPVGDEARLFERLLGWCDQVLEARPMTINRRKVKIRKNRLFSLFLLFQDLEAANQVRVERELSAIRDAFWSDTGRDTEPTGRVISVATISKHYAWFVQDKLADVRFTGLDPQRAFSDAQKEEIWRQTEGKCAVCGETVDESGAEYDHIEPWILGGRTKLENGRLVHFDCHERGALVGRVSS